MASGKKKWFKNTNVSTDGTKISINKTGYHKTDGTSLVAQVDGKGVRYQPGFTPNDIYLAATTSAPHGWYGNLLDAHLDSNSFNVNQKTIQDRFDSKNNEDRFGPFSKRDTLKNFDDTSTDYFQHDLHIAGKTPFQNSFDDRYAFQGDKKNEGSARLSNFKNSDYENQDPVVYGFEIIIDAVSSPLLNGSIYDFLRLYPDVSELQARSSIYYDFKNQFIKLFKTRGTVDTTTQPNLPNNVVNKNKGLFMSIPYDGNKLYDLANADKIARIGKKAYLSHYLQKIEGLSNLVESNSAGTNKYLVDYGKDVIKISFAEDVSSTMGTLAHLYKLLYWSRPLGKGMIPENLLRFNCDIIVSECRNFNRVRKNMDGSGKLEVIKDNVSRYIYSLKECQFYFDKMPHEDQLDMGNIKAYGDGLGAYEVQFDYKYSTTKFEKWVPSSPEGDGNLFGQYVGYNNGALWKLGNKGSRTSNSSVSNPTFYTVQTNTLGERGVINPIVLNTYSGYGEELPKSDIIGVNNQATVTTTAPLSEDDSANPTKAKTATKTEPSALDKFKENSKKVANKAAKNVANFAVREINQQISTRVQLLNNTLSKIKNSLGLGSSGISGDSNVYPKPYSPVSFGIYFDVRNQLFNFIGEDIASALSGFNNVINPYNNPMKPSSNPLNAILQKYSSLPSVVKTNSNYVKNTLSEIVKKYGKGS